jgi:hypothetical protein
MSRVLTVRMRNRLSSDPPEQPTEELEPLIDESDADDAALDSLRGELVRALDRLAAGDQTSSACFRRI